MEWTFVSAGWPHLYEIPGLHNCIPMLFADATARFRRHCGDRVVFVSGADEHGSRVEFVAEGLGVTPADLVDRKVEATRPLLDQLGLSMSLFARTTDARHKLFVTRFMERLKERGAATLHTERIAYCATCDRHLPDRFAEGRCPRCNGPAFGNQCNDKKRCGAILDAFRLVDGRCAVCAEPYQEREREHLYLPFGPLKDRLRQFIETSFRKNPPVITRALSTLDQTDGVSLTRDTVWGIPLPDSIALPGRTVYSWVDSLLGKISTLEALEYEETIWRSRGAKKTFFLGGDGVGFYAVLLPALLMSADRDYSLENWSIVINDVLIYEGGICSKSSRNSIGLPEALALLPGDYWRFAIFHAEAEAARMGNATGSGDIDFRWDAFAVSANRVLGALDRLYGALTGTAPPADIGSPDLAPVIQGFAQFKPGAAFARLVDLLLSPEDPVPHGVAAAAIPLLECFLPDAAGRARDMLAGKTSGPLFPELPLNGAALRGEYVRRVGERRAHLDLAADLLDVRADQLCVCPARLDEG